MYVPDGEYIFPAVMGMMPTHMGSGAVPEMIVVGIQYQGISTWEEFSMLQSTPFLLFDGNCAEAMTFYQKCLGGELTLTKLADTPMKDQFPPEKYNRIINAHLKSGAIEISATDWMASPMYEPIQGTTCAIFILGGSFEELKTVFDKLKEGASTDRFQELHEMPFGTYGQFYDQYGVHWIFKGDHARLG